MTPRLEHTAAASITNQRIWVSLAAILVCGYGLFGRTFAYIGVPPAKIFIGDIVLGAFLVFQTAKVVRPWFLGLVKPSPFSALHWTYLLFLCYGILEFCAGMVRGYSPLIAAQNLVFNVYPLYLFLGLTAAATDRALVWKVVRFMTWASCIYGISYFVLLKRITATIPGTDIPIVSVPGGMGLALLALPCFVRDLRKWWLPLAISTCFVLAGQIRAEWTSLAVALVLQSILTGKIMRVVWATSFVTAVLLLGFWTDLSITSPSGRGGVITSRDLVGRAVAAVDIDAAREISNRNADFYAGTVSWRKKWWDAIWAEAHSDVFTALFGHGYGYELKSLVPYLRDNNVRSPHNVFFFNLGYTGWVGVVLFFSFQGTLALTMWRVWRHSGQAFGLVFWAATIVGALFGNFFETPFGAIPYYLIIGMCSADLAFRRVPVRLAPRLVQHPSMRLSMAGGVR